MQEHKSETSEQEGSPLVRGLVHIHAFVTLFLSLPRASQVNTPGVYNAMHSSAQPDIVNCVLCCAARDILLAWKSETLLSEHDSFMGADELLI